MVVGEQDARAAHAGRSESRILRDTPFRPRTRNSMVNGFAHRPCYVRVGHGGGDRRMQAVREEDTREKAGDRHGGGRQQTHGDAGSRDTPRQAGAPSICVFDSADPVFFHSRTAWFDSSAWLRLLSHDAHGS